MGYRRSIDLPGYDDGWFAVQDPSADRARGSDWLRSRGQLGVGRLACRSRWQDDVTLAELMNNAGQIVATDIRPERLQLIEQNYERLNVGIIQTRLVGEDGANLPNGPFDSILVDVPCSNTGVLGKRPEARWRIAPEGVIELNRVQEMLLNAALDRLAPQGRLVYSTCSIEPAENECVVAKVLAERPQFRLIEQELFLPGSPTDGGYQALLCRSCQ